MYTQDLGEWTMPSNSRWKNILILFISMATVACAPKRPSSVNLVIPPTCLTAPIVLHSCDTTKTPPVCRKSEIRYKQECAQIAVTRQ